jgi:hypothetical protein
MRPRPPPFTLMTCLRCSLLSQVLVTPVVTVEYSSSQRPNYTLGIQLSHMESHSQSANSPTDCFVRAVSGPHAGRSYVLAAETRIGRDPHANVFVGHDMVARWQCILVWDERRQTHFIDRGWFRPVFINDKQVTKEERVALQAGDRIRIEDTTLVYEHLRPVD